MIEELKERLKAWADSARSSEEYSRNRDDLVMEMYWRGARIAYENALGELESLE